MSYLYYVQARAKRRSSPDANTDQVARIFLYCYASRSHCHAPIKHFRIIIRTINLPLIYKHTIIYKMLSIQQTYSIHMHYCTNYLNLIKRKSWETYLTMFL